MKSLHFKEKLYSLQVQFQKLFPHWTFISYEDRKVKKHLIRFTQIYSLKVPAVFPHNFQL